MFLFCVTGVTYASAIQTLMDMSTDFQEDEESPAGASELPLYLESNVDGEQGTSMAAHGAGDAVAWRREFVTESTEDDDSSVPESFLKAEASGFDPEQPRRHKRSSQSGESWPIQHHSDKRRYGVQSQVKVEDPFERIGDDSVSSQSFSTGQAHGEGQNQELQPVVHSSALGHQSALFPAPSASNPQAHSLSSGLDTVASYSVDPPPCRAGAQKATCKLYEEMSEQGSWRSSPLPMDHRGWSQWPEEVCSHEPVPDRVAAKGVMVLLRGLPGSGKSTLAK